MTNRNSNSKAAQQHRDPYDPNPTLVDSTAPQPAASSPVPLVQFATPEARANVVGPLRDKYDSAAAFARSEWDQAVQCQADIDGWGGDIDAARRLIREAQERIEEREHQIEGRELDKKQHMLRGEQGRDVANPTAVFLAMAGDNVPQITAPTIEPGPPALSVADTRVHPLDTSAPLSAVQGSPMDNPHAGHCIRCGQQVWRVAQSETSPNGVTHGWGATCDPNAEQPEFADLGEGRAVAS